MDELNVINSIAQFCVIVTVIETF